ncbi:hypothetical protein D3C73_1248190 [compost metagenome]
MLLTSVHSQSADLCNRRLVVDHQRIPVHNQLHRPAHIKGIAVQSADLLIKTNAHDQGYSLSVFSYTDSLQPGACFENVIHIFAFMLRRNLRNLFSNFTDLKKHSCSLLFLQVEWIPAVRPRVPAAVPVCPAHNPVRNRCLPAVKTEAPPPFQSLLRSPGLPSVQHTP